MDLEEKQCAKKTRLFDSERKQRELLAIIIYRYNSYDRLLIESQIFWGGKEEKENERYRFRSRLIGEF